jgi:hypothetical protein
MKEILQQIFTSKQFKVKNDAILDYDCLIAANYEKANFYLVIFVNDIEELQQVKVDINKLFNQIKTLDEDYDNRMDKNLSMLVCLKRDNLHSNQELNKLIFQIEEDPYFFKKYVLTYTESQLVKVKSEVFVENSDINNYLYGILNDDEKFQTFKANPFEESEYSLVSKSFIKLPFLSLESFSRTLDVLPTKINQKLAELDLQNLRDDVLKINDEISQLSDEKEIQQKIFSFLGDEDVEPI